MLKRIGLAALAWSGTMLSIPSAAAIFGGRFWVEKVLTQMAMPWSILIAALFAGGFFAWAKRLHALAWTIFGCGLFLWIATTPLFVDGLFRSLEHQIPQSWDWNQDEPLDLLVVFGGGTFRDDLGRSQQSCAGDRVGWAARLYLLGKVKKLITTGDAAPGKDAELDDPSSQTIEIWKDLQIPMEAIDTLHGVNTFEELQSLSKQSDAIQGLRIGLLSSAFHMPRIMRLARKANITAIPVLCDFRTRQDGIDPIDFLPSGGSIEKLEIFWKEKLASFIGR